MESVKLSIIIPAYNCEDEITDVVESIENQYYSDYEIIIVNDGSTDNTENVIKNLIEKNDKIKLINEINSGPAFARNNGIDNATGDYIMFIDSDDKYKSGLFDDVVSVIDKNNYDLIIFGFSQIFIENNKKIDYIPHKGVYNRVSDMGKYFEIAYKDNLFNQVWNKVFRRKFIIDNNIKFKNYRYGEDRLFVCDALENSNGICFVDKIYYEYIIDKNMSLISSYYDKKAEVCKLCFDKFDNLNKLTENDDNSVIRFMLLKGIVSCLTVLYSEKTGFDRKRIKSEFIKIIGDKYIKSVLNEKLDCGFAYEIMRKIIISGNYLLCSLMIKFINFTQKNLHSLFLKFRH